MLNNAKFPPLILSGPSGVGKSYLENYLCIHNNFKRIQSTTTRPQRQNEVNGKDYNFISEEEYKKIEWNDGFITSVYNLNAWYGFEKSLVEQIQSENKFPITICIPQIIDKFIDAYPNTIAFYLHPSDYTLLTSRMSRRGDSQEKIQHRLDYAYTEFAEYQKKKEFYKDELIVTESNFDQIVKQILHYYS